MIRIFGLIFLLHVTHSDISSIRQSYKSAIYSEKSAEKLLEELEDITLENPLKYAYKGATHALLAQYLINPYSKLESVKTGSMMLDDAVIAASANMEIRYLRYSIEKNLPSFLPYRKHIKQDELRIVNALVAKQDNLSPEIHKEVIQYMLKNAQLSTENKNSLEDLIN